jgi:choline dehydrogenase
MENNLDPDIARDVEYHNVGGYQSVGRFPYTDKNVPLIIKGFQELGYDLVDFNGPRVAGVMHLQATQDGGERRSTNRAYLEPIRHRRHNIRIITNVRVTRILIDSRRKAAYGVEYVGEKDRSIRGKVYARKETIVSAGSINSPQLLMLSGIGPRDTLERLNIPVVKDLKVGHNLHDHVGAFAVNYFVGNSTRPNSSRDFFRDALLYSRDQRTGPWSGIGSLSVVANTNSRHANTSVDYPDIEFSTIPSVAESADSGFCDVGVAVPWCYYDRVTFMPAVLRPDCRGHLTINSSDPFARPLIYPNSFCNQHDMDVVIDGFKAAVRLADTKTFKDQGFRLDRTPPPACSHLQFGTDDYWVCAAIQTTHSNFHPVGTCKMGPPSDPDAVVDPQLRVYGIESLRVIDSSIMPLVTSGNTNAPSIMIGEKGADLVKQSYDVKAPL